LPNVPSASETSLQRPKTQRARQSLTGLFGKGGSRKSKRTRKQRR
jgi:hypothetical protein